MLGNKGRHNSYKVWKWHVEAKTRSASQIPLFHWVVLFMMDGDRKLLCSAIFTVWSPSWAIQFPGLTVVGAYLLLFSLLQSFSHLWHTPSFSWSPSGDLETRTHTWQLKGGKRESVTVNISKILRHHLLHACLPYLGVLLSSPRSSPPMVLPVSFRIHGQRQVMANLSSC